VTPITRLLEAFSANRYGNPRVNDEVSSGRRRSGLIVLAAALVATASCTSSGGKHSTPRPGPASCTVTKASDRHGEPPQALRDVLGADAENTAGKGNLWVLLAPEYHGDRSPDGSYRFKIGWWRGIAGPLVLTAKRLDGRGTAHVESTQDAYPPTGMLPTNVVTSTRGCYRLTGTLTGTRYDSELRVVIKIG
jgi:hypothetical protein